MHDETPHPVTVVCVPRFFGPHAGIRCIHCNDPVPQDPRVAQTAASPSSNLEATAAAVAARGSRCSRCTHWTFRPARVPSSGRYPATAPTSLCANCTGLGNGSPVPVRIPRRTVDVRLPGIRRDPSADAQAATWEGER